MFDRRLWVFEKTERNPPRHESLFFARIDAQGSSVFGQLIGKLRFVDLERPISKLAPLGPPLVKDRDFFRICWLCQDDLGRVFDFSRFAQQLCLVKGKAVILLIGWQRLHQCARAAGLIENGEAGRCLLLFGG